jgi:Apea-like HEPN
VSPLSLICFRKDKPGEVFIPSRATKFKVNYTITKDIYDSFKSKYHLNEIDKILNKDFSRCEYDEEIFTAIRWIGMGIHDTIISDKFLKFAIALECLLLGKYDKKDEELAKRWALSRNQVISRFFQAHNNEHLTEACEV